MLDSILIREGRPSAFRTFRRRLFRSGRAQNFVRPAPQSADIEFPCPSCDEDLAVPASQAGKKARCRHCYAPLRNPDPTRERGAINLSQTFDPIARPHDYPLCGHRATAIDYMPRSALAAVPLLCLIATAIALIGLAPKGDVTRGAVAAAYHSVPLESLSSNAIEAEQVVAEFLDAPDWTHGVGHVHSGLDYAEEVAALSEILPRGGFSTSSKLNEDGSASVRVRFRDGSLTYFRVANFDGEDLIVWNDHDHALPDEQFSRMVGAPELEPE